MFNRKKGPQQYYSKIIDQDQQQQIQILDDNKNNLFNNQEGEQQDNKKKEKNEKKESSNDQQKDKQNKEKKEKPFIRQEFLPGFWENFSSFQDKFETRIQNNYCIPAIFKKEIIQNLDKFINDEKLKGQIKYQQYLDDMQKNPESVEEILKDQKLRFLQKMEKIIQLGDQQKQNFNELVFFSEMKQNKLTQTCLGANPFYTPIQDDEMQSNILNLISDNESSSVSLPKKLIFKQSFFFPRIDFEFNLEKIIQQRLKIEENLKDSKDTLITPIFSKIHLKTNSKTIQFDFQRYKSNATQQEILKSYKKNCFFQLGAFNVWTTLGERLKIKPSYKGSFVYNQFIHNDPYRYITFSWPYEGIGKEQNNSQNP